jgi:hypothetical protein
VRSYPRLRLSVDWLKGAPNLAVRIADSYLDDNDTRKAVKAHPSPLGASWVPSAMERSRHLTHRCVLPACRHLHLRDPRADQI